jgi:5-methylcytosine-specific restriction enzyme subunit McrC
VRTIVAYEYERLIFSEEDRSAGVLDALLRFNELHKNKYFDGVVNGIKLKQYVGIIQVNGLTIEILPKIDKGRKEETWREVLIQMLKNTGRLNVDSTGSAHVRRQNMNLLEIYFEMYLRNVQGLLHAGLVKKYRKETGNVKALKGKIDFAGNIRENLIHKERFYTTHQVYDVDHLIHQVLSVALDIVTQFSRGTRLNDVCRRVQLDFPEVQKVMVNEQTFNGIKLNRKSAHYEDALNLARLIILNYSPDIKSGKEKMLSILFDMNTLWEEYVLATLKKECRGTSTKVRGQSSKRFWGSSAIRPDIVIEKEDGEVIVVDTKWKRLANKSASVEDLRQMYAYGRFWDAEKVMLLYPGNKSNNDFVPYRNQEFDSTEHQCKLGFVNVIDGEGKLDQKIGEEVLRLLR